MISAVTMLVKVHSFIHSFRLIKNSNVIPRLKLYEFQGHSFRDGVCQESSLKAFYLA